MRESELAVGWLAGAGAPNTHTIDADNQTMDGLSNHLMKRFSRSWSRPTKDFMVRKRANRSWISRF